MNQIDLFSINKKNISQNIPLAMRMSPMNLDEFVGQGNILGPDKLLRRTIEADRLSSVIFFGPPGCGKSALSRIIASKTKAHFEETNAVTIGINDIRHIIKEAKYRLETTSKKTVLLLDEIHHFNKTQQDALLPDIERGIITLIGITTENPFFYINSAILSRSIIFEFKHLNEVDLEYIINNAVSNKINGFGNLNIDLHPDAKKHLIKFANGDARRLLNAFEIGVLSTIPDEKGVIRFDLAVAEESMQKKTVLYDKTNDEHYDHVSAFIKSMRGSDPDAALYWMAKMLKAGEDPRFIARRIIICASEDVGNADPHALMVANAALNAIEFVGMPEGRIALAQAVTYVSTAPKSNAAYIAIEKAQNEVENFALRQVPIHLKDAAMDGQSKLGHGIGYKYPHDYPNHFVEQEYWTNPKVFYQPSGEGYEIKIKERLTNWRKKRKD